MPQTIALQRGTTFVNSDGNSFATLFTQSGGIATRVIANQLSISLGGPATANLIFSAAIYLQSSGGQTSVIGMLRNTQGSLGMKNMQWPVGSFTTNPWTFGLVGGTSGLGPTTVLLGTTQNVSDMGAMNTSNITVYSSDTSHNRFSTLPQNFYIGPSDAIRFKCYAYSGSGKGLFAVGATISYSFTTITES